MDETIKKIAWDIECGLWESVVDFTDKPATMLDEETLTAVEIALLNMTGKVLALKGVEV